MYHASTFFLVSFSTSSSQYVLDEEILVIPSQLRAAGYNPSGCIAVISLCCCFGSIFSSILTDLPFVVAPLTSISIYLSASLQENRMSFDQGRMIVTLSGFGLLLIGLHKPLQYFIASVCDYFLIFKKVLTIPSKCY